MPDTMSFPKTLDEFMEQYKIVDAEQVYTNGTELVPIFRIKQWEDAHEPRKGKWIPFLEEYHDMFKCSNCGNITRVPFKCSSPPYYYCPNCGAVMREEKTDETN